MQVKNTTKNHLETRILGKELAEGLSSKEEGVGAVIIGLEGDLGAGKTTFLQGFAEGLGVKDKILSPTFVIMNRFPLKKGPFKDFYHLDCYRIEREEDMAILEFKDIISGEGNIVCIEWPEKVKGYLPKGMIKVRFKILEGDNREINIEYGKQ